MAHTFDTYLQEFLNWLRNEKTCSENTIIAYRKDLEQFGTFLTQEMLTVEEITYRELRFYMASLQRNQELKKTTLSRKTAALKSFFKFLNREGLIEHNPADLLSAPKKEKHLPSVITEIDMTAFPDNTQKTFLFLYVTHINIHQFRYAKTGTVKQFKNCFVAKFIRAFTG